MKKRQGIEHQNKHCTIIFFRFQNIENKFASHSAFEIMLYINFKNGLDQYFRICVDFEMRFFDDVIFTQLFGYQEF